MALIGNDRVIALNYPPLKAFKTHFEFYTTTPQIQTLNRQQPYMKLSICM